MLTDRPTCMRMGSPTPALACAALAVSMITLNAFLRHTCQHNSKHQRVHDDGEAWMDELGQPEE